MKCTEIRENLAAYLDGEIEGASRRTMDAHLSGCPDCLAEKRAQAAAWRLLDMAGAPPAARAGLKDRILARTRTAGPGRVMRLRHPAVAAAAAVLLVAGGTIVYLNRSPGTPAPSTGAPSDQLLENLAVLESLDVLQDDDVTVADGLADYPVDDLETLGG
jgi:anti-sigma factor RsiW